MNQWVTRTEAAQILTQAGFKIAPHTLATLASRGGGPEFCHFRKHTLYDSATLVAWAVSNLKNPEKHANVEFLKNNVVEKCADAVKSRPDELHPEAKAMLNRENTAKALRSAGFPIAKATLATMASRGGGPVYRLFGKVPLYQWGEVLAWANGRLQDTATNTSIGDSTHQGRP